MAGTIALDHSRRVYTQKPPIMKAVINQALAFAICHIWTTVVNPKIAANATAAPAEGS
jgi:hypothetical protein